MLPECKELAMLRRVVLIVVTALAVAATPGLARATHSLDVSTDPTARLLSPARLRVTGTLTCIGQDESGSIGVVVLPVGSVTLSGGGSRTFSCAAGETLSWTVIVRANSFSTFSKGRIAYDTFAFTECSDEETDCPSDGDQGVLKVKKVKR
jgi:hypothetical protein